VDWELAEWGAFGGNDIRLFEMARMNYLRVQQNALLHPAEMIRRAPPFKDVPFLYDNRQTVPRASTDKRFAVVVFKNGVLDSQLIPIDLPTGPDYAVKPIVGLVIDLWCGISGKLHRRAGCDGQIRLPELGSELVSGKSASDVDRTCNWCWELHSAMNPPTLDANLRSEDAPVKPKWPGLVMSSGEVFVPTAVSYRPLRTQSRVAARAGGPAQLADKKAISLSGADGPVIGRTENLFIGSSLGSVNLRNRFASAQVASSPALCTSHSSTRGN
jgi:hypothetical protein